MPITMRLPNLRRSLVVCAGVAILVHTVVLYEVRQEIASMQSQLQRVAAPMFTRQIARADSAEQMALQKSALTPVAAVKKPSKKAKTVINTAQYAIDTVANNSPINATASLATATPAIPVLEPVTVTTAQVTTTNTSTTATQVAQDEPPSLEQAQLAAANYRAASTPAAVTATLLNPSNAALQNASSVLANNTDSLAVQGEWPADTRLSYKLSGYMRGDLHGSAQVQWTRDPETQGENYQVMINIFIGPVKAAQLTSQGKVAAAGLLPQVYEEAITASGVRSVRLQSTDLVLQSGSRIPRPAQAAMQVQDTASQFVELGHRFSTGKATLADGQSVTVWLARPGGLDEWVYDIGPAETINLPVLGDVQAHHLTPRPQVKPRGSIVAEMWFAPRLQYLPVRIKINIGATTHVDLQVEKIEQR